VLSADPDPAQPAAALAVGEVLGGRYRVDAVLATGSMGTVYAATNLASGDGVAIKGLLPIWGDQVERDEAEAWFRREGAILLGLRHPAIPRIHAALEQDGRHYLAMDLVQGETLEEALQGTGNPGLPEVQVLLWADQILDLLGYLHNRPDPLIFRDLKPANVMRTALDGVQLIDFGTARIFARRATRRPSSTRGWPNRPATSTPWGRPSTTCSAGATRASSAPSTSRRCAASPPGSAGRWPARSTAPSPSIPTRGSPARRSAGPPCTSPISRRRSPAAARPPPCARPQLPWGHRSRSGIATPGVQSRPRGEKRSGRARSPCARGSCGCSPSGAGQARRSKPAPCG